MAEPTKIGNCDISANSPVMIIAEIGLNHNGSVDAALELIDVAVSAGCNMVKFQKRTPELCVPRAQWDAMRATPWGEMRYIDYRHRVEFDADEYRQIALYCEDVGIMWTASAWDIPSAAFLLEMGVPCHKVPSACLTDHDLLREMMAHEIPIIMSTGMSTPREIYDAVMACAPSVLMHCTSTYPCLPTELNLRCINTLRDQYGDLCHIGYSGHETGIPPTLAAVAMGAKVVERHITMNRASWGSDHAASLEPVALAQLVRQIRTIERSLGDGNKRVYDSELPIKAKLRRM